MEEINAFFSANKEEVIAALVSYVLLGAIIIFLFILKGKKETNRTFSEIWKEDF